MEPERPGERPEEGRPRVLAIEDEPTIRRFYERLFEAKGYEITLAPTGTAAMKILESGQDFDVILLDVRLPGLSGQAIWKLLELKRPELCNRVIVVTGDTLGERTRELIERIRRPYLEKPFSARDLLATIEEVLRSGGADESDRGQNCVGE